MCDYYEFSAKLKKFIRFRTTKAFRTMFNIEFIQPLSLKLLFTTDPFMFEYHKKRLKKHDMYYVN